MLIPVKKDEEEQEVEKAPSNEPEAAADDHARKVMTKPERTELIARTMLFALCMAIYIWYRSALCAMHLAPLDGDLATDMLQTTPRLARRLTSPAIDAFPDVVQL